MDGALAAWRGRRLDGITKADVRDMLDSIAAPAASNQALSSSQAGSLSWAVAEDLLKASPLIGLQKPHAEKLARSDTDGRRTAQGVEGGRRDRLRLR